MVLRTRLLAAFGDRPIGRTTRLEVQSWVKALDDGILAASPCRKISLPPIVRSERFTLEPPHVQAIAAAVPDRFRALVETIVLSPQFLNRRIVETPVSNPTLPQKPSGKFLKIDFRKEH